MKISNIALSGLFALTPAVSSMAINSNDMNRCHSNNPAAIRLIQAFCSRFPKGLYGSATPQSAYFRNSDHYVGINALRCQDPKYHDHYPKLSLFQFSEWNPVKGAVNEFIPNDVCLAQLYTLCAQAVGDEGRHGIYGDGSLNDYKCQDWFYVKHNAGVWKDFEKAQLVDNAVEVGDKHGN
ncbi:hypothetical protein H2203_008442 [Taxawa tesnikishii (nom. ined.)]|nr:hypothetical protein H2203_008442 [Dothideales sp. JES 119]